MLHRDASKPDEPALVEKLGLAVSVPRGYICHNASQLLSAWELLAPAINSTTASAHQSPAADVSGSSNRISATSVCPHMLLRPVIARGGCSGVSVVVISSPHKLADYSIPPGGVVLELPSGSFSTHDKVAIRVGFLQRELLAPVDVFRSSEPFVRSSQQPPGVLADVMRTCRALISSPELEFSGAGTFEFSRSADGRPLLVSIEAGFSLDHFPVLFARRWAPGSRVMCWRFTPGEDLDVWAAWYRLHDIGACFHPRRGTNRKPLSPGVWPLVFSGGEQSVFVAVAKTDGALSNLHDRVMTVMHAPALENLQECVPLDSGVRRIWCGSPRPEYRRITQRYNLPTRCLSLVRKKLDIIILPGDNPSVVEFWKFIRDVNELDDDQVSRKPNIDLV